MVGNYRMLISCCRDGATTLGGVSQNGMPTCKVRMTYETKWQRYRSNAYCVTTRPVSDLLTNEELVNSTAEIDLKQQSI